MGAAAGIGPLRPTVRRGRTAIGRSGVAWRRTARWMAKGDVVGQTRLIHKVFGLAV